MSRQEEIVDPKKTAEAQLPESKPKSETLEQIKNNICPVSQLIFQIPVIIGCGEGHNLEKDMADELLNRAKPSHPLCPSCREPFSNYTVNRALRDIIAEYIKENPDQKDEQYQSPEPKSKEAPKLVDTKPTSITSTTAHPSAPQAAAHAPQIQPPPITPVFTSYISQMQALEEKKVEFKLELPTLVILTQEPKKLSTGRTYPQGGIYPGAVPMTKVLFVGDRGTKRSQLLLAVSDTTFTPGFINTIGIDFKIHYLDNRNNRPEKYQIWDTAGQEAFHSVTASFYRGASVIFLFGTNITPWIRNISQLQGQDRLRGYVPEYHNGEVTLGPQVNLSEVANPDAVTELSIDQARNYTNQLLITCSALVPTQAEQKVIDVAAAPARSNCC